MSMPKGAEQDREKEKRLDSADLLVFLAYPGVVGDLPRPSSSSLISWSSSELLEYKRLRCQSPKYENGF